MEKVSSEFGSILRMKASHQDFRRLMNIQVLGKKVMTHMITWKLIVILIRGNWNCWMKPMILKDTSVTPTPIQTVSMDLQSICVVKFHQDRKSTRLNSSHVSISYAVFCLKKKYITHSLNSCVYCRVSRMCRDRF